MLYLITSKSDYFSRHVIHAVSVCMIVITLHFHDCTNTLMHLLFAAAAPLPPCYVLLLLFVWLICSVHVCLTKVG